ncbi:hypothetical protein llap_17948 [Limosa lapponica baueri]|uniref:Uncharacterized protein n=1 Tax=Limosa lapponica baueri TaxID=1758121 RepID=A0A2I0TD54_LIMLA|nr:hypothetical protein llap_17948 [Limosa lapponica baueri]
MGLDFSYNVAVAEELGNIRCGGIPMAIGVQAGMATPALTSSCVSFVYYLVSVYRIVQCLSPCVMSIRTLGIHVAKKIDKLGMRSSDTAQIFFEDVRVPRKNLIGEEGKGFTYQMLQFQEERLWGVATGVVPHQIPVPEMMLYGVPVPMDSGCARIRTFAFCAFWIFQVTTSKTGLSAFSLNTM